MTDVEYEALIAHLRQQIDDLTAERDRLKAESTNASGALAVSNENNAELSENVNNSRESLQILGINEWGAETEYAVEDRVQYRCALYRCVQAHTAQAGWTPDATPALWARMSLDAWPEWVQPTGVHDAYMTGDRVSHNGQRWVCTTDYNVYEPGVYGWELNA